MGESSDAGVLTIMGRLPGIDVVLSVEMERLGRERERPLGRSWVRACVSKVRPAGRRSTKGSVGNSDEAWGCGWGLRESERSADGIKGSVKGSSWLGDCCCFLEREMDLKSWACLEKEGLGNGGAPSYGRDDDSSAKGRLVGSAQEGTPNLHARESGSCRERRVRFAQASHRPRLRALGCRRDRSPEDRARLPSWTRQRSFASYLSSQRACG